MREETRCRHIGYSFRLSASVLYMHHPIDRIAHTTAFGTPVVSCMMKIVQPWTCMCCFSYSMSNCYVHGSIHSGVMRNEILNSSATARYSIPNRLAWRAFHCGYHICIVRTLTWGTPNVHVVIRKLCMVHLSENGARCSSVVRAFAHGAMGRRIDPSWWAHWAISRSSQCSTTGVTKAVVCVILSVLWCI